jgi:hypothetical protein
MDRVDEIQAAICNLSHEEHMRLLEWFRTREDALWDEQMDKDSAAGRLDFLVEEAERDSQAGLLRDWPPPQ